MEVQSWVVTKVAYKPNEETEGSEQSKCAGKTDQRHWDANDGEKVGYGGTRTEAVAEWPNGEAYNGCACDADHVRVLDGYLVEPRDVLVIADACEERQDGKTSAEGQEETKPGDAEGARMRPRDGVDRDNLGLVFTSPTHGNGA
jgi:hypothetical protein